MLERTNVRKERKMSRMVMGALGAAGLLALLAVPAQGQENGKDYVWHTDGKRCWRTEEYVKPFVMPTTMTIEVAPGDRKEGDVPGFKYLGKRTERVYFREVQRPAPEVAQGHECAWRLHITGKQTTRENYCVVNGVEQACPGFDRAGHCLAQHQETPGPSVR